MPTNQHSNTAQGPGALDRRTEQASGALDKRTGATPDTGPIGFQQQLDAIDRKRQMIEAKARPKASFGDQLLKPENLIKLGLAAAGALSGNENLAYAGAGLGMGTLQGTQNQVQTSDMDRQKEIDTLTAMVDKQQTRLVTLLQSQPGMFLDDAGNNMVEPGEWRDILMMDVPINVHSLTTNAKKGTDAFKAEGAAIKVVMDTAIKLGNVGMLRGGMRRFSDLHGLGWSDAQIADYSHMTSDQILGAMLEDNTLESIINMNKESQVTGKSLYDPELEAQPVRRPDTPQPSTPAEHAFHTAQVKFMDWLEVGDHMALYEQNPWEAQDMAFAEDPAGQAALQDGSRFFRRGSEAELARQKALVETWKPALSMYMTQNGGLTAPPAARKQIVQRVYDESEMLIQVGRNVTSLREDKLAAGAVGQVFAKAHGLPVADAGYYGSRIVVRAKNMMRSLGLEPHKQDDETRKDFQNLAGLIIGYENRLGTTQEEVDRMVLQIESKYIKE